MSDALVSIIIPVYRVEQYLDRCLESVIRQSYQKLEIILVDDGSPDRCPQMCEAWAERDSRIKVIHKSNGGLSDARNCGLRAATGEYVAFVDSDDWITSAMVERMTEVMESHGADMVVCRWVNVYSDGTEESTSAGGPHVELLSTEEAVESLVQDTQVTNHAWAKLYKRALIPADVFPVGKIFEDIFTTHELILRCRTVACLNEAHYYYWQNQNGLVRSRSIASMQDHLEGLQVRGQRLLREFPELEEPLEQAWVSGLFVVWMDLVRCQERSPEHDALRKRIVEETDRIKVRTVAQSFAVKFRYLKPIALMIRLCPWSEKLLYHTIFAAAPICTKLVRKVKTVRHRGGTKQG